MPVPCRFYFGTTRHIADIYHKTHIKEHIDLCLLFPLLFYCGTYINDIGEEIIDYNEQLNKARDEAAAARNIAPPVPPNDALPPNANANGRQQL
ncbi:cytoplasmic dynein 2 heavy chain 1-like protein [Corchorus capsularis]|uniref:Cytoplasmic dynein 2 heavy chain 1-like protein n=1 Tax=Corchorus capsularis TaxID=210143 RepID=A0A1R3GG58_COCAP|nr:cytoplasmic dynein 2 heavy chain 1-like protein [Corchorus capsularis]